MDLSLQHIALLLSTCVFIRIDAYPNGLVTDACVTMMPNHGAAAQNTTSPYILSLAKATYSPGENIDVILTSTNGSIQFKGFLIQARSGNNTTPTGSFKTNSTNAQTLTCSSAASSVSQTSNSTKTSIQVTWVAPTTNITDIQIRATVVQSQTTFWTNVVSTKIAFAPNTTQSNSTASTPASTIASTIASTNTSTTASTTTKKSNANSHMQLTTLNFKKILLFIAIFVTFAL